MRHKKAACGRLSNGCPVASPYLRRLAQTQVLSRLAVFRIVEWALAHWAGASLLFAFLSGTEEIPPSSGNTDPAKLRQRWPPSARGGFSHAQSRTGIKSRRMPAFYLKDSFIYQRGDKAQADIDSLYWIHNPIGMHHRCPLAHKTIFYRAILERQVLRYTALL